MAMNLDRILLGSPTAGEPSRSRVLKVDVTTDLICPFCLIGVKQIQMAVSKYNLANPFTPLQLVYRLLPYQLDVGLRDEPITIKEYREQKYGPVRAAQITAMIKEKIQTVGYELDETGGISSTHLAHRLLTYALINNPSKQLPLAMALFEAFHVHGYHLSNRQLLAAMAVQLQIFPTSRKAAEWLDGCEYDIEVKRAYAAAHRIGVTGVPFFVFQDRYAASGAMGVDQFVKLFEEILKREDASSPSATPSPSLKSETRETSPNHLHGLPSPRVSMSPPRHRHAKISSTRATASASSSPEMQPASPHTLRANMEYPPSIPLRDQGALEQYHLQVNKRRMSPGTTAAKIAAGGMPHERVMR